MFKLQRLEITGFKSFADHTEVVFTGDGITAIVGPNGCGKSNIAESISWVLGEQRVKTLRGAEMKDVIFQGSRNRPASGMAEVVLHLVRDETFPEEESAEVDDIDSTLEEIDDRSEMLEGAPPAPALPAPAEQATSALDGETGGPDQAVGDEGTNPALAAAMKKRGRRHWRPSRLALGFAPGETVTVTRRLYRSGESEYLLNGRACRLRDIQDLFSGTGLSGAHYAIIEQGRIGQILSAKPLDRRALIEEAAGITKFRVRQRAAEARLEAARANMRRVSDIISEVEKQVGSLRRQAAKARRYRALREELRELLRRIYVADERALAAALKESRARLDEAISEEQALARELASLEDEARRATTEARACEDALAQARALAASAALQRDRREREHAYHLEQIAALEKRLAEIQSETDALIARESLVKAECETLREREAKLRVEAEASARSLSEAEAIYGERLREAAEAEAVIEAARAELLTHTAVAERLMELERQLDATLERLQQQAEGFEREGTRAQEAHAAARAEAEALSREIATAEERLSALMAERDTSLRMAAEARSAAAQAEADLAQARDEHARVRHRLDTLMELDARRAHYSQAVQRLFSSDAATRDFTVIGTLADMLRVDPHWERAAEGVFGQFLQAVVVPTPDDAARAALWLRDNDAGRANFIVVGLHGASDEEANGGGVATLAEGSFAAIDVRLGDLLGASRELLAALGRALPRETGARISATLDQALALSLETGATYVTAEGDWVAGGTLVSAGGARALGEGGGLLAFKRELRELEMRSARLQAGLASFEQARERAHARVAELENAVVSLSDLIGREERAHVALETRAKQAAQEIERTARHMRVVADDAARLAEERRELEARRSSAAAEAQVAETHRRHAAATVAEASARLAEVRRVAEAEGARLSEQRAATATAAERRRAAASELKRMEAERDELRARVERFGIETAGAVARIEELRRSVNELEQGAADIAESIAQAEGEIERLTGLLAAAREKEDALAIALTDLNHRAAQARDRRAALEVQRAEIEARLGYLRHSCMTELSQSLEEVAASHQPDESLDLEAARARAEELRTRIESFGAVNMMALEELAEAEERFNFLTSQRQDIVDGIASTEEALREIKRRSRERFNHAFEVINRNFGELFAELFGGGRGEMSLIDADDVLESGIDIIAQPPGKRLQNVLLLSGGEKAMAALALVLAIFRYRPSPFCLLDEVDAPLDEANIGRFTAKIVEMSENTQFLIITHNKRTMEIARALYGVTMEEAGISKLVSVRFE
jgi:chromosome segregation protein